MSAKKIGFALFGLGNMGLIHAKNIMLSSRASLKWVIRNNIQDAQKFVDTFNLNARCSTPQNLDPVFSDPEVNAVLICSPTAYHEPQITQSLEAGKAILCEKPITADLMSTLACYEKAEKNKQPLFCAFHRKFDPSIRKLYNTIQEGKLGKLKLVKVTSRDLEPPPLSYVKTSGGILNDSTIHDLNLSMWLCGSKPQTVYTHGAVFFPEIGQCGDIDQVLVTIQFDNGTLASIDNSRCAKFGYDQRTEVLCDNGMLRVENQSTNLTTIYSETGTASPGCSGHYSVRYPEAYAAELEHFLDVLEGRCELLVNKDDVLNTMKLVRACQQSLKMKAAVQYSDDI